MSDTTELFNTCFRRCICLVHEESRIVLYLLIESYIVYLSASAFPVKKVAYIRVTALYEYLALLDGKSVMFLKVKSFNMIFYLNHTLPKS